MDEVSSLPKLTNDQHSSTAGHLANYRNSISEQMMKIIGHLQSDVKSISDNTTLQLTQKMNEYRKQYDFSISSSQEIIDSMTSTLKPFDDLREELKSIGENILSQFTVLKKDCVDLYSQSFTEIKPFVDQAFINSKDILHQVPSNISERLQYEVNRINANFLKSKQDLTKVLYQIEINTRNSIQNYEKEFEQRKDQWKDSRFFNLIEQAKTQLDSSKFVDFGSLYDDFHREQGNFTLCFRKTLINVTFLLPPEHFSVESFDEWTKEVDEDIECHNNFLKIFESKFTEAVTQKMNENSQLISQLETELVELKNESEANNSLTEIYPLFKSTQKVNSSLIEKIHKYWSHRQNCIKTSFDSIKAFIQPLVTAYSNFLNEIESIKDKEIEKANELREKSNQQLNELEDKLQNTQDEINVLVSDKEIDQHVEQCRVILGQIEAEYHQIYKNLSDLYANLPLEVGTAFEKAESKILELLKLKKIDGIAIPSSAGRGPKHEAKSSHGKRGSSKRRGNTPVIKTKVISIDDAKFEEVEQIVIIPTFDDFIDEPVANSTQKVKTSVKGKKPPKPKQPTPKNQRSSSSTKGKTNPIDEVDESELPEFNLIDVVPKIDDVVSIFVYSPMPEEISDWPQEVRTKTIKSLYDTLNASLKWANDQKRKEEISDELNERMRIHMPRMSSIQLNVAEARKTQILAQQNQLESFFKRQTIRFNTKYQTLQNNLEKLCEKMASKCEEIRKFIAELPQIKTTSAFSILNQNKTIAENNLSVQFDLYVKKQQKEIDDFFAFFSLANQRFKDNVLFANDTYSNDEREVAAQYFQRMEEQIEVIKGDIDSKSKQNVSKIQSMRDQISTEYGTALPHHMSDVGLIESVLNLQKDSSAKFENLIFNNYAMEKDLKHSIETVKNTYSKFSAADKFDHQAMIDEMFALLEDLRQKLVKRGAFLKQLKSKISSDPIKYNLTLETEKDKDSQLNDEDDENSATETTEKKKSSRPQSKSSSDRKSKQKSPANKNAKKAQKAKVTKPTPVVLSIEKNKGSTTFEGSIEQLHQEFLNSANEKASNYYSSFKTRTFPITRPDQIPATQQELIDKLEVNWTKLTEKVPSICAESNSNYKYNVVVSTDVVKDAQHIVFDIFTDFFINEAISSSEEMKLNFQKDLIALLKERKKYQQKMTPKFADINNFDEFNKLVTDEEERNQNEKRKIQNFTLSVIENEKSLMNNYLSNVPLLVKNLFLLFDKIPFIDDLKSGRIEKVERKTMRQLLKDKSRSAKNPSTAPNRPFYQRVWPNLNSVMKPLNDILSDSSQAQITFQESGASLNIANDSNKSKRKRKISSVVPNNKSSESQKSNETLNSSSSFNSSLDTPVHRSVIISRKDSYENYEQKLDIRVNDLKKFVASLKKENEEFEKSWNDTINELCPNFKHQRAVRSAEKTSTYSFASNSKNENTD